MIIKLNGIQTDENGNRNFEKTIYHELAHNTSSDEDYANSMAESGMKKQSLFSKLFGGKKNREGNTSPKVTYANNEAKQRDQQHLKKNTVKAAQVKPEDRDYHFVEKQNQEIYWDDKATSQETTKSNETYLGANVIVATHNRDENLNEPINSAKFELYKEDNKEGVSATINGNTVPSDTKASGTLAEGLYPARTQARNSYIKEGKEDKAVIINEGKDVPTAAGSPKPTMNGIFLHSGNNYRESLFTRLELPISKGCQTTGCRENGRQEHNNFMNEVGTDFNGNYYLRGRE